MIRIKFLFLLGYCAAFAPAAPAVAGNQLLTGGSAHSCYIDTTGTAYCWGANNSGQLGDGTTVPRLKPVPVTALGTGVQAIVGGDNHTCALDSNGGVQCWGANPSGQLGNGTFTNNPLPVGVAGLASGVLAIAAGDDFMCAVRSGGSLQCWGGNTFGQLGDGSSSTRNMPVNVSGLSTGVQAVSAGERHACALLSGGAVRCWGFNDYGQLGDSTGVNSPTPVTVTGLSTGAQRIATGDYHSCALTDAGPVRCWGRNDFGQLGDGTPTSRNAPVAVTGLTGSITTLDAGGHHVCALDATGIAQCWGLNDYGQQGDDTTTTHIAAAPAAAMGDGLVGITAGQYHTCALSSTYAVVCWGYNATGQVGDGTTTDRHVPVLVQTNGAYPRVAPPLVAGNYDTCALTGSGGAQCWGTNSDGQLGDGTRGLRLVPTDVVGLGGAILQTINPGEFHTCGLTTSAAVLCWGDNAYGQLGDGSGTDRGAPGPVIGLAVGVRALVSGDAHSCVINASGGLQCWGYNHVGQLGNGTTSFFSGSPTPVTGLQKNVLAVSPGERHSCALTLAGGAYCWGDNTWGELGDGTNSQRLTPVPVRNLGTGLVAIGTGDYHTCALTTRGGVKCWGRNDAGHLGNGTGTQSPIAVDVFGLGTGVKEIAIGDVFSCALTTAGAVKCWGDGTYGALGDGALANSLVPVQVIGLDGGVETITAGSYHACAITMAGAQLCWGYNGFGEIGDGTQVNRPVPVPVIPGVSNVPVLARETVTAPSPATSDLAGTSVAVADSVLAVAVPGREMVLVFNDNGTGGFDPAGDGAKSGLLARTTGRQWGEPAAVLSSGGKALGDKFGTAVAVAPNGRTIVVGAPLANGGTGQVEVFHRTGPTWNGALSGGTMLDPVATPGVTAAGFGSSVAIDDRGNIVVGAPDSTVGGMSGAGSAYAFRDSNGVVEQNGGALSSSVPQIDGSFGSAVAVDEGNVAVGAPDEDNVDVDAGAAYVFTPTTAGGNGFQPVQPLPCQDGGGIGDKYGCGKSVGIRGDLIVVGAPGADSSGDTDSGAAEVFSMSASFARSAVLRPVPGSGQRAGSAVAINDSAVAIGAPAAAITRPGQGRAFVYDIPEAGLTGTTVPPDVTLGSAANGADSQFGTALAVSRRNMVVGAPRAVVFDSVSNARVDEAGRGDTYAFDRISRGGFE